MSTAVAERPQTDVVVHGLENLDQFVTFTVNGQMFGGTGIAGSRYSANP